jgi:hypothetical protein
VPSRLTVYHRNVPPIDRTMVRCAVCSQWVDADKTQQPEEGPGVQRVEGSVYFAKKPGGEIDMQAIDKTVLTVIAPYAACWFCSSPRWLDGAAGPLGR